MASGNNKVILLVVGFNYDIASYVRSRDKRDKAYSGYTSISTISTGLKHVTGVNLNDLLTQWSWMIHTNNVVRGIAIISNGPSYENITQAILKFIYIASCKPY